ncbi:hypothetical protein [Stenotrophomonas sp. AS012628]|uniref:hypothetical protein n=1 Tax=Stenotrophomonas sp. AS012628 TaxID=2597656 RepID=UPI00177B5BE7|nr:hypothetical protein [Stenotrophomonas sp. AS012628]
MATFLEVMRDRLIGFGFKCEIADAAIKVEVPGELDARGQQAINLIREDESIEQSYQKYLRVRSKAFDPEKLQLTVNNSVEVMLSRLDPPYGPPGDSIEFIGGGGEAVLIAEPSDFYLIEQFFAPSYDAYFERRIRKALGRRYYTRIVRRLLPYSYSRTAKYTHPGRKQPSDLMDRAIRAIDACLFKLSVDSRISYSIFLPRDPFAVVTPERIVDRKIPRASYEAAPVIYYKLGQASTLPSQAFLSYYHVLEFYFHRVAEKRLHHQLASMLNDTNFRTESRSLDRVISLIRGGYQRSDETELLRAVIDHFIPEPDLLEFLKQVEQSSGSSSYFKKVKAFGKELQIVNHPGQAIGTAAKTIKEIRNAIVHSSDNYKRDECHIPLTETEAVIGRFIPVVQFLAERVIFGSAS